MWGSSQSRSLHLSSIQLLLNYFQLFNYILFVWPNKKLHVQEQKSLKENQLRRTRDPSDMWPGPSICAGIIGSMDRGVTSASVPRSDLVPVYSFGENDAYKQVIFEEGSYWRIWQKRLQKLLGFAPCLFHGCGLFFSSSWGIVPFCKPITTIGELAFWVLDQVTWGAAHVRGYQWPPGGALLKTNCLPLCFSGRANHSAKNWGPDRGDGGSISRDVHQVPAEPLW